MTLSDRTLDDLLKEIRYVLFDFDGPICNLFAKRAASRVAKGMVSIVKRRGFQAAELSLPDSPIDVLRDASRRWGAEHPRLIRELAERLVDEEVRAARDAEPVDGLEDLLVTLARIGCKMAITTNNSAESVMVYLKGAPISGYFGGYVFGRQDPESMKPEPDCLIRAMKELRTGGDTARTVLMVGDSPADVAASRGAGVSFLGYSGGSPDKLRKLLQAGVPRAHVLHSLGTLRDFFERREEDRR